MRPRYLGFLLLVAGLALPLVAAGQDLPSVPTGPGYLAPLFPSDGLHALQYTVEVRGRVPTVRGRATDHFLSFSGPTSIPGVSLAPGTYVFRQLTPAVMQVASVDGRQVYAMFMTAPLRREQPTAHHEVWFERPLAGAPARLVGLFLPNRTAGYEPLYRPPSSCERILRDLNLPTDICYGRVGD